MSTILWHAYFFVWSRRGLMSFMILLLMAILMGACHKTYDDWMNN